MPIFDQGYQHWKGPLAGHAWQWLAITKQGVRGQLQSWLVRILLLLAWLPALMLVVALALWGLFEQGAEQVQAMLQPILPPAIAADPHVYRQAVWTIAYSIFFQFETFFIMLLVLMVGPNLISRDLRFNALPMYFSRPLTRLDYFLGKLGIIAAVVAAVAVLPAATAYVLGVCFSLDLNVIRDTWCLLPASILYGSVIVISTGTMILAFSSLSRRSLYVGIAWVGLWVISAAVAGALNGIHESTFVRAALQEEMAKAVESPQRSQPPDDPDEDRPGQQRGRAARSDAWQRARQRAEQASAEAAPINWRPLCSYSANLARLGEALLNTDAAWVEIGRAFEPPKSVLIALLRSGRGVKSPTSNERRLANRLVLQYPWIWSAGVLASLLGLSLWTLSMRVKSLDRLR